jgi:hypothetical protein
MAGQRITISFEGVSADKGDVRLQMMIEKLESVRRALAFAEDHAATGGQRRSVYYRVVDMHHSQAAVVIEPVDEDPDNDRTNAIVYEFNTRLRQIQNFAVPEDVAVEELEAYRALVPKPDERMVQLTIGFDAPAILKHSEKYVLTTNYDQILADLIGPEEVAWGTLTGRLDAINLHERNVFYLWPRVGPKRVYCTFKREIREDVRSAIGHYVEVAGRIHYRRRSNAATSMTGAYSVEVLDAGDPGTRLSDLRGISPNLTGGLDTREFVDSYDEDW